MDIEYKMLIDIDIERSSMEQALDHRSNNKITSEASDQNGLDSNEVNIFKEPKITIKTVSENARDTHSNLLAIEEFVDKVISTEKLAFHRVKNKFGRMELKESELARYFYCFDTLLSEFSENKFFDPKSTLFFESCNALRLDGWMFFKRPHLEYPGLDKPGADVFNDLVQRIRDGSKTTRFKKKIHAQKHKSVLNQRSSEKYITALFEEYSRLLILRIDLSYRDVYVDATTLQEAQADLRRLLNNRRSNKLFSTMVGYIARLEYGDTKGPHFHVVFFLNGADSIEHEWLADEIGKYWRDKITSGRGYYFNCNKKISSYNKIGIGKCDWFDFKKRKYLLSEVISYLNKNEQQPKSKSRQKIHTFMKGVMPKKRTSSAGRPRKELPQNEIGKSIIANSTMSSSFNMKFK